MEMLAFATATVVITTILVLNHRHMRKASQRLDLQARLLAEIADLIADAPASEPVFRHLHVVREPGGSADLAAIEALLLQLHMCSHRHYSSR